MTSERGWIGRIPLSPGVHELLWAVFAMHVGVTLLFLISRPQGFPPWRIWTTLALLAVLLLLSLAWERLWSLFPSQQFGKWSALFGAGGLCLLILWVGQTGLAVYLVFMVTAQAVLTLTPAKGALFGVGLFGAFHLVLVAFGGTSLRAMVGSALGSGLGLVFVIAAAALMVRHQEQTERSERLLMEVKRTHAELLAAREREREIVVSEERVRMAREIHDGLGHYLTALSVQLQVLSTLLGKDPARAAATLETCRVVARDAMDEVRRSVAVMRKTPLDGRQLETALAALVDDFRDRLAMDVALSPAGNLTALDSAAAMTLYRATQEALTNCQKHASNATRIGISLECTGDRAILAVRDNGRVTGPPADTGFGLAGMRERVHQLGGSFQAGPADGGGFELLLSVPVVGNRP